MRFYMTARGIGKLRFIGMIEEVIYAAKDHFDPVDRDDPDAVLAFDSAMEVVSHQIAVFLAQRYNVGVPTHVPMEYIDFDASDEDIHHQVRRLVNTYEPRSLIQQRRKQA